MDKQKKLIEYFSGHLTDARKALIESLLKERTRYVSVVLEDIHQSLNASAILRSCDGFGVQDVHIIEQKNNFIEIKRNIAMGTSKWLNLHYYNSQTLENPTQACITKLKNDGYTIVATSPHATDTLETLSLDNKVALLFGTEDEGLTKQAFDLADKTIKIPMYGFAESFNVSVSAALCLYALTTRIRALNVAWQLTEQEQAALKLLWYKSSVVNPEFHERRFLQEQGLL